MAEKIQHRGHCQCCGRVQAVVRGRMAKHGYEVKDGYFQGVCQGHRYEPIEEKRDIADSIVKSVREDVVNQLARAEQLKTGKISPMEAKSGKLVRGLRGHMEYELVPYADAPAHHQEDARKEAIWRCEQRARMGTDWANSHEALVNRVHGQPLEVVKLGDAPAPIVPGEKRLGYGVMECKYVDGPRVYWRGPLKADGKRVGSWTGVAAWRKLPLAPEGQS